MKSGITNDLSKDKWDLPKEVREVYFDEFKVNISKAGKAPRKSHSGPELTPLRVTGPTSTQPI